MGWIKWIVGQDGMLCEPNSDYLDDLTGNLVMRSLNCEDCGGPLEINENRDQIDCNHPEISRCDFSATNFFSPHQRFFPTWLQKTALRLHQAHIYEKTDPDSALVKYRIIGEDTIRLLYAYYTGKKITVLDTAEKMYKMLESNAGSKAHCPYFSNKALDSDMRKIEVFVKGCEHFHRGAHEHVTSATEDDAVSAKLATVEFLKYVTSEIITVPNRPRRLKGHGDFSATLCFCPKDTCRAPLIHHYTEGCGYESGIDEVLGCVYCESTFNWDGDNIDIDCYPPDDCVGILSGPDIFMQYYCEACSHRIPASTLNLLDAEEVWDFLKENPVMRAIRGATVIPTNEENLTELYIQQIEDSGWTFYSMLKLFLQGKS